MGSILLVPIHLDALWLKTDLSVLEPKCDFTRLPFWDGSREVNPDIANISEELLSRPFQDRGLQLRAGVHLHWALPDALTRGTTKTASNGSAGKLSFPAVPDRWLVIRSKTASNGSAGKLSFPAVPDRWVVIRSKKDKSGKLVVERRWIVESDYLHPEFPEEPSAVTAIPFPASAKGRPYRFLGRQRPFTDQWSENFIAESLNRAGYKLTAVGYEPCPWAGAEKKARYGEPTFAAFYPNCRSVFGFYDAAPPASLSGTQYDLIGWYGDHRLDCLKTTELLQAVEKIVAASQQAGKRITNDEAKREAIEQIYKWRSPTTGAAPDLTVCYARLVIDAEDPSNAAMPEKAVTVAVGNTATEALSAYLAETLKKGALLEERLEALHLGSQLEGKELDIGVKFREARHEKAFTSVHAGTIWVVREENATLPPVGSGQRNDDSRNENLTLPPELGRLLNRLNILQQEYDQASHELESMQRQLFADWYKYMLCVHPPDDTRDDYPDVDEVRHFIEKNDLLPIKRQRAKLNALDFQRGQGLQKLMAEVLKFSDRTKKPYAVQPRSAPRYWRPNEPALLIVGVEPTLRHNQDGRLHPDGFLVCQGLTNVDGPIERLIQLILDEIDKAQPAQKEKRIGFSHWTEQPWNPFSLEWRVELFTREGGNNLDSDDRDYDPDFITANYQLKEDAVDLEMLPGQEAVQKAASIFVGSSLLTPHAKLQLQEELKKFLENRKQELSDQALADLNAVAEKLKDPKFHAMAQSLTGFNEALLMRKQTMQLPIADPLGIDDTQSFNDAVREAVGSQNRSAPQPLNDFHPIRAGVFKLIDLRLVDTFGRTQDLKLDNDRLIAAEAMQTAGNPHLVSLAPRLAQPARLNFRWLSAGDGKMGSESEVETNAHPATTPVCGWLGPNNLDGSLLVYDNEGKPLGLIDKLDGWMAPPGAPLISPHDIQNTHLRKLVEHLLAQKNNTLQQKNDYFDGFLAAIEGALENIDPEGFAQHEAMALLMGRPLAVVRATLDLELRGRPAVNADWNVFRLDLERDLRQESIASAAPARRDSDQFTRVRFPIRLGDERQLNDGLVGYWKEKWKDGESYEYEDNRFFAHACDTARVIKTDFAALPIDAAKKATLAGLLQNDEKLVKRHSFLARFADGDDLWQRLCDLGVIEEMERDPRIRFAADEPELFQSLDDEPQKLTMLIDPRGAVHATCGLMPTKAIRIPPDQFAGVLQNLAVTFLSSPILSEPGKIALPLPTHAGYEWSWLANIEGKWQKLDVDPANPKAGWAEKMEIAEGWLKLMESPKK
jgi:hypothetical protein